MKNPKALHYGNGFILPTVIIFSLIIMSIGLVMLQYVTASTNVIQNVYYDTMANEAADAGAVRALSCIKQNQMTWTDTNKLTPNSDCTGTTITGTNAPEWYISHPSSGLSYSTFEVDAVEFNNGGLTYTSTGKVVFGQDENHVAVSGTDVYSSTTKVNIPYTEVSSIWQKSQGNIVTDISANAWNTCVIANQLPYCWGGNAYGESGNGAGAINLVPTRVNSGALTNKKVSSIEAGHLSGCAVSEGRAICWGRAIAGQLGNGSTADVNILPTAVIGEVSTKNITQIGMGDSSFSNCLLTEGEVYCAGSNAYAGLGQVDYKYSAINTPCGFLWFPSCIYAPTSIEPKPRYTSGFPAWVDADLPVFTPVFGFSNRPLENQSQLWDKRATNVGTGAYGACATLNGGVFCWGDRSVASNYLPWDIRKGNTTYNVGWKVTGPSKIAGVLGVGESTACTVASSKGYCWGTNPGDGSFHILPPSTGTFLIDGAGSPLEGQAITDIKYKNDRSPACVIGGGSAYCWGNFVGYTPSSSSLCVPAGCENTPGKVDIDNKYNVTGIASGREHGCAVANGAVYCWGRNTYGELGNPTLPHGAGLFTLSPTKTDPAVGTTSGYAATKISSGENHNCAIINGRIFCWGANGSGQLGTVDTDDKHIPITPTGFVNYKGATDVSAGWNHTCGVVNGDAYCWGDNTYGQLGTGDTTSSTKAKQISLAGETFTDIAAGKDHSCGIADGKVYCWGRNNSGQLGDGTTSQRNSPTLVPIQEGGYDLVATDITAGNGFTCAIADAKAWCWGDNVSGQIGKSPGGTQLTPFKVPVLSSSVFTNIDAGGKFVCGVVNGYAHCWGDNTSGQLGRGVTGYQSNQYQVLRVDSPVDGSNTTSLSVGVSHACSISDHVAYCWGSNAKGELGNGNAADSDTPEAVVTDPSVLGSNYPHAISAGGSGSCTVANGKIACWGDGNHGQIGVLGNVAPKLVPTWTDDYKVGTFILDFDAVQMY